MAENGPGILPELLGQSSDLNQPLARTLLENARQTLPDSLRGPDSEPDTTTPLTHPYRRAETEASHWGHRRFPPAPREPSGPRALTAATTYAHGDRV